MSRILTDPAPGGWVIKLGGHKYYVHCVPNPRPDVAIARITMVSRQEQKTPLLLALSLGQVR